MTCQSCNGYTHDDDAVLCRECDRVVCAECGHDTTAGYVCAMCYDLNHCGRCMSEPQPICEAI